MTREEAYRQGMAEGGYTQQQIDERVKLYHEIAAEKGIEPFSGPDWQGLDSYIKRKTQNNEERIA